MAKRNISGRVVHKNLEGGFWGIIGDDGKEWLPVNFPEQLKVEGKKVDLTIQQVDVETAIMWGTPARILAFHT